MSFGGPGGGQKSAKPIPPERGSFPLDHDGECKPIIADYLRCLRRVKGTNDQECRMMAKEYLRCRMENNLMAPDEMKNLGFAEDDKTEPIPNHAGGATAHKVRDDGKKIS
ncbi:MAG: Cytochrome c oxidase assembly protein cox19 [Alectoria fallacina]|uniref:Cytochrome c oxidase assembly protein cox19 n=1 Tax=Alectoria fallacina TaxID=1903189 RepID=A0A8H3II12_9LECA|nr:MAG: Cytochrome c oxidase assembly protein cox19 [Alectoria fallacina]